MSQTKRRQLLIAVLAAYVAGGALGSSHVDNAAVAVIPVGDETSAPISVDAL